MEAGFVFVDKEAQKDEFMGVQKQKVAEMDDAAPEKVVTAEDAEAVSDEPAGENGESSKQNDIYNGIEDMDYFIATILLSLFDDTRATWLSTYAFGDIDHSDKYRYYKNLDDESHKPLVKAMAFIVRKYRLSNAPEVIVLIALATSTYFLYTQARQDKKEHAAEKENEKQKQQEKKQNIQQQNTAKIVKMKKNVSVI